MKRITAPQSRSRLDYEPMQYAGSLQNDLWGVVAFPGKSSWVVLKTASLELLGECAPGSNHPRLVEICKNLATHAFQVNVYDGHPTLLCEVSETGHLFLSGHGHFGDPLVWHGQQLSETHLEAKFRHLPYQHIIEGLSTGQEIAYFSWGGTSRLSRPAGSWADFRTENIR